MAGPVVNQSVCSEVAFDQALRRRTKVVQFSCAHSPLDARIFYKHCRTLSAAGYEVVVLAPDAFAARAKEEDLGDIRIETVKRPATRKQRLSKTDWEIYRRAVAEDADVYHFHDPELIPVGILLKLLHGKRVIYDVHEDLPLQILVKDWIPTALRKVIAGLAGWAENIGAAIFDATVAATPPIARKFPKSKTVTVQNFPLKQELIMTSSVPYRDRAPVVVYVGSIAKVRGIQEMIDAYKLLSPTMNVSFAVAGHFESKQLELEIRQAAPAGFDVLGWQSRGSVREILNRARVGIVALHPIQNYMESQPLKLFEYMSIGLPVIASDFPLWREIVESARCGLLVDARDHVAIAEAARYLLENPEEAEAMGRRGRAAVLETYNWDAEGRRLLQLYDRLFSKA